MKKISEAQRKKYRKIDPFWGTQMPCWTCGKCSCETCHPKGPCPKDMAICKNCAKLTQTMEVKICKRCGKSTDEDKQTLQYCTACARRFKICRSCGKNLKSPK